MDEFKVYWQAHQSTSTVLPENTMAAFIHAWNLGGIPEADIRTTGDGAVICMHDRTGARTTNALDEEKDIRISELTMEVIGKWDAGIKTGVKYTGEKVPLLSDVFTAMKEDDDRLIYLDLKDVDLALLCRLIREYGVGEKTIFAHNDEENCRRMHHMIKGLRTMLWIGGDPRKIKDKFNKVLSEDFSGLDQIQIHLYSIKNKQDKPWFYEIDREFLEYAYDKTKKSGVDLEVLVYEFDEKTLFGLLDMGIRWFATDHPEKFADTVKRYPYRNG